MKQNKGRKIIIILVLSLYVILGNSLTAVAYAKDDVKGEVSDPSSATDTIDMLLRIDKKDLINFIFESSEETSASEKNAIVVLIVTVLPGVGAYGYIKVHKSGQENKDTESKYPKKDDKAEEAYKVPVYVLFEYFIRFAPFVFWFLQLYDGF